MHIVVLSGAIDMCKTLWLCPLRSATLVQLGYFQRLSWFSLKPCELKIYLSFLFQINEQTWLSVWTVLISFPVSIFQNLIVWSDVPPPVANKFLCHGHHARALTAALCPCRVYLTLPAFKSQIRAVLSLLPDARPQGSCLSPQTYPRCPWNLVTTFWWAR